MKASGLTQPALAPWHGDLPTPRGPKTGSSSRHGRLPTPRGPKTGSSSSVNCCFRQLE